MRKVSLWIRDNNDLIVAINGNQQQTPITALQLASSSPDFWIEKSTGGYDCLCTNVPDGQDIVMTMLDSNQANYLAGTCDFVGGHPIRRPVGI